MELSTRSTPSDGSGSRVVVIGAGAWGTTLAMVALNAGNRVTLASRKGETLRVLQEHRRHPVSLPGVSISPEIDIVAINDVEFNDVDIVILAVPVQRFREAASMLIPDTGPFLIVSAAKGIELETLLTPVSILKQSFPGVDAGRFVALSGPNLAPEIAVGRPATTVVAAESPESAIRVQQAITSTTFRVYASTDVIGVELGGALKNIIAIGAGIADGFGAGNNAKAAFMTRGIAEITRLGVACGAQPLTFAGLSGIGDLIATCSSNMSRNHTVGRELAAGHGLAHIINSMSETAEGVDTTRAAHELAKRMETDTPIIHGMYRVLFEGLSPADAAAELMSREPTYEQESVM